MTVEALPNRISIDALMYLSQHINLEDIIAQMADNDDIYSAIEKEKRSQQADPFAAILGNILAFAQAKLSSFSETTMAAYVQVLLTLTSRLPSHFFNSLNGKNHTRRSIPVVVGSDDEGDMDFVHTPSSTTPTAPPVSPHLAKWLNVLIKPSHFEAVVRSCGIAGSEVTPAVLQHTERVASFLLTVMSKWSSEKMDIATSLLFKFDGLLKRLWHIARQSALWAAFASGQPAEKTITDARFGSQWAVLVLFCELFVRLLTTLADDELFGKRPPIPVEALVELSQTLKAVTFDLYWNDKLVSQAFILRTNLSCSYVLELFTKVVQQTHARDSRRSFCPENHWLIIDPPFDYAMFAALTLQSPEDKSGKQSRARSCRAILNAIPFVIPFETRVTIFRAWIRADRRQNGLDGHWAAPIAKVTVRRQSVFEDGFTHLNALGAELKDRIAIEFVSEQGLVEAGIDGGGVFKEFLTAYVVSTVMPCLLCDLAKSSSIYPPSLSKQAFDMNYGLFRETGDHLLFPSPHSYATQDMQLHHLEFLGRIVGKALYENVLMDVSFAIFFLAKWLGQRSYLDDLPSLDPALYQGLMFLKHYDGDVEGDLGLSFSIDDAEFGLARTIDLIPNGASVAVTKENRIQYIYLMANYKLNTQIQRQCQAFFSGLSDLIDPEWIRIFNQQELQMVLGGVASPLDLIDLKKHTTYSGGFDSDHPTIIDFWSVVEELADDEKSSLIKFVTSCARPPLLGFGELEPGFSIRNAGGDIQRLPTSATCVNLLKMPAYTDRSMLRSKLLYAINAGAGFELS
ncbi:hypothetical protein HKX48_001380 [Thoreauomyces humboldtii]|nr:hypothetical protein HKX48_001380 [Thoreauomyces humboldtii]